MTRHSVQPGTRSHADRGDDLYETRACATEALLRAEQLPPTVWESAAGRGAIVRVLRDHGHTVIASDLIAREFPLDFVDDFLTQTKAPAGVECILTNPPFKIVDEFIAHALDLCPRVIMLARLALLESTKRTAILERRGLARIHVFRGRLPMMHRDGWAGPRASSATPFAWYVWDRGHHGPATFHRIGISPATEPRGCNWPGEPKTIERPTMPNEKRPEAKANNTTATPDAPSTAPPAKAPDGFDDTTSKKPMKARDDFDLPTIKTRGDGFDDADDGAERSLIKGEKLKFTNTAEWISDTDVIGLERQFIVIALARVTQKWIDGQPVETRVLESSEQFPDVDELNGAAPRSEWREFFGRQCGPWQNSWLAYLLDPKLMTGFTWPTSTFGGFRALQTLKEDTRRARLLQGGNMYPLVTLADRPMKTKFGGRQRPHFNVVGWRAIGPAPASPAALPDPRPSRPFNNNEDIADEIKY